MEDLINLITAFLIQLQEFKSDGRFSIKNILEQLRITNLSYNDIFDIVKYLENLGIVDPIYTMGDAYIKLTIKGRIEFDKKPELEKKHLLSKLADIKFEGDLDSIAGLYSDETLIKAKKNIIDFIDDLINNYLKSLDDWNSESYISDLEIIKIEINKKNPDISIIETKLYSLMDCMPIRSKIKELRSMLNINK